MRYFIDTIAQPVEETVEDEEVRIYGLICID
jgi:hypothetical protein